MKILWMALVVLPLAVFADTTTFSEMRGGRLHFGTEHTVPGGAYHRHYLSGEWVTGHRTLGAREINRQLRENRARRERRGIR